MLKEFLPQNVKHDAMVVQMRKLVKSIAEAGANEITISNLLPHPRFVKDEGRERQRRAFNKALFDEDWKVMVKITLTC